MERNFNNEFERFLKENANQYRLYPSAKVWNGIHAALHTRRKWFGLGIILLLLTGTLITLLITNSSKETVITVNKPAVDKVQTPVSNLHSFVPDERIGSNKLQNNLPVIAVPGNKGIAILNSRLYQGPNNLIAAEGNNFYTNATSGFEPLTINITDELTDQNFINTTPGAGIPTSPKQLNILNPFYWTIESVLNSYTSAKRNRRLSFQFNFTPTISYRKLSANKSFLRSAALQSNVPYTYAALYDINSAVTHKPDMGLELGLTAKYSLATNFKIKAGVQFNINRYDIKAFNYPFELTTIALRGDGGTGVDSFRTVSSHRNFNGYSSNWLQNFYFQISLPVGIEVNLIGDEKVQFGVAGTIQPTYVLGDRAYLLSTDYKNYAEVPWLIRRWNVNTALETFVSYSTGKMNWQVGPQVRYQLLSSFVDKYPVKENLFDFGLKVGISLNK
jgi:hypothetical protein